MFDRRKPGIYVSPRRYNRRKWNFNEEGSGVFW